MMSVANMIAERDENHPEAWDDGCLIILLQQYYGKVRLK